MFRIALGALDDAEATALTHTRTITELYPDHLQKGVEVAKRIADQTDQTVTLLDEDGVKIKNYLPDATLVRPH